MKSDLILVNDCPVLSTNHQWRGIRCSNLRYLLVKRRMHWPCETVMVMVGNSDVRFGKKTDVSQLLRNGCFYWTRKWKVERRLALIKMWSHHKGNHHHHLLLLQTQHHCAPLSAYLLVHRRLPQRNISDLCRLTFLCAAVASVGWRKADNYSR